MKKEANKNNSKNKRIATTVSQMESWFKSQPKDGGVKIKEEADIFETLGTRLNDLYIR